MSIKISVIIPFYNTPLEYFQKCVEAVIRLNPFEIILVDDCSDDERILEYVRSIACTYLRTSHQSGFDGLPFNLGVQNAKGDYICRVDSDDILLELPTEMKCDIHFGNADRVFVGRLNIEDLILAPRAILNAMVIKKKLLVKYTAAIDKNVFGDVLLVLQLLYNKHSYDIHQTVNYLYIKRPNSIQASLTNFQHRLRHMQTVARFCYLENIAPKESIRYLELATLNLKYGTKSRRHYYKKRPIKLKKPQDSY